MANGIGEGPRYQPEFSLGERMAGLEAEMRMRSVVVDGVEEVFDEKLNGVRKELGAVNQAQKEAISKSEISVDRRLELIGAQMEADRSVLDSRLGAVGNRLGSLERGESQGQGAHRASTEFKGTTLAIATLLATLLGGGLIALIIKAVGG